MSKAQGDVKQDQGVPEQSSQGSHGMIDQIEAAAVWLKGVAARLATRA